MQHDVIKSIFRFLDKIYFFRPYPLFPIIAVALFSFPLEFEDLNGTGFLIICYVISLIFRKQWEPLFADKEVG